MIILLFLLAVARLNGADASTETLKEQFAKRAARMWSLQPVVRPEVPSGASNPIDAFVGAMYQEKGLHPAPAADKLTLLRRVYFDLVGLPPTVEEQDAFLNDNSPEAYDKVVDGLLANAQHGVRWARHWLDVLRYADLDGLDGSVMPAAPGIYLWRDWVIVALNHDMPYDQFVRAQILGNRYPPGIVTSPGGRRSRAAGAVEDTFALGFLARAAVTRDDRDRDIPIAAVETISSAFMGMTVACAKCHDHKFDPISRRDFYSMKALFDPLVLKNVMLATPAEIFANGQKFDEYTTQKAAVEKDIESLVAPYRNKLYEERVALLTPDVQAVIRKPERLRSQAEQKTADDYFPVLRIDPSKVKAIMPKEEIPKYDALLARERKLGKVPTLPSYWTVEEDKARLNEPSYILTTGDPKRPEKDNPVQPGFPFQPEDVDFHDGRRETFVDWLTAPKNPLFARVAVNRVWAWHFGEGLQKATSDFGLLGGKPSNQRLLDYLAAEFVAHGYSMKWLHKMIVTSATYRLSTKMPAGQVAANQKIDPGNVYLWRFRLQRLEAEPIWDSILYSCGDLDLTVGGRSFQLSAADEKQKLFLPPDDSFSALKNRRGAYLVRGYIPSTDVMSNFLTAFDVDDGRAACPMRTQTVTAPQALFTMNNDLVERESGRLADYLEKKTPGDLTGEIRVAYQTLLSRPPTGAELDYALTYVDNDPKRLKNLAWLLFNLDEFIYVR
ncbi:MAG TPA: DUF1549 and DUF1553 domain-containing protein [Bryobacteraceae bacterium]|jgi:hypothetical protein